MNTEHLNQWMKALRSGSLNQTRGTLATAPVEDPNAVSYCCLGAGCKVAEITDGMDLDKAWLDDNEEYNNEEDECSGVADPILKSSEDVPPPTFHAWLGLEAPDTARDIYIDWPTELVSPGGESYYDSLSCAGLNDSARLTFPQIADVIERFGLRSQTA